MDSRLSALARRTFVVGSFVASPTSVFHSRDKEGVSWGATDALMPVHGGGAIGVTPGDLGDGRCLLHIRKMTVAG